MAELYTHFPSGMSDISETCVADLEKEPKLVAPLGINFEVAG
jgi:hypothetical protein